MSEPSRFENPKNCDRRWNLWPPSETFESFLLQSLLSGVPDLFDRNKILSGGDLSHYQVPHCIRVFFYFVPFVFIHYKFEFC